MKGIKLITVHVNTIKGIEMDVCTMNTLLSPMGTLEANRYKSGAPKWPPLQSPFCSPRVLRYVV